jgi:hypothetical protein
MRRFLITMLMCFSVSHSEVKISHISSDTMVVSFDLLRLGLQYSDRSSFGYNWSNQYIHKDSVVWTIDGKVPDSGDVYISGGATSKELSPDFSTGSRLSLSRNAIIAKYSQGVHSVEIVTHFPESTVTNTWQFRYFETKYKVIRAQTVIDTSYNEFTNQWTNYTNYRLLGIQQADTSVFGKALGLQLPDSLKSFLNFDTNGITREFVAKKGSMGPIVPRDTIDGMIIQIQRGVEKYDEWFGPVAIDTFLKQDNPPFTITEALHTLTGYLIEKGIERRSGTLNSELKLGPVFDLGYKGDPGWSLVASHDSSSWYFTYRLGYGDCPCGCTEWTTMKFRVLKDSTVMNVTTSIRPQLTLVNPYISSKSAGSLYYYNLRGQRAGFRDLKSKTINSGVFILSDKVNTSKNQTVNIKLR